MSRITASGTNGRTAAWGHDHVCGLFVQVFDADGECVIDKDWLFDGLSVEAISQVLREAGVGQAADECHGADEAQWLVERAAQPSIMDEPEPDDECADCLFSVNGLCHGQCPPRN
jgi:hypothetical protein